MTLSLENILAKTGTTVLNSTKITSTDDTIDDTIDKLISLNYDSVYGTYLTVENGLGETSNTITLPDATTSAANSSIFEAWDPRLARVDGFIAKNSDGDHPTIVPFGSATAAGAFFDLVFTIERGVDALVESSDYDNSDVKQNTKSTNATTGTTGTTSGDLINNTEKIWRAKDNVKNAVVGDSDSYGIASIVNPYTLTKLCGGLVKTSADSDTTVSVENHMYDIRDLRRFYGNVITSGTDDVLSVTNPTTTNIITYSNNDKWGRTPYYFLDFVFCKYWNIIPNNHLITLRKYHAPVYDNLLFSSMQDKPGDSTSLYPFAPIATVVTYFGEDTGNTLSLLFSFSTGTKWRDISAKVHEVTGDTGSDPRALIDSMFSGSPDAGFTTGENNMLTSMIKKGNFYTGKMFSYGKFIGLLSPDGYNINQEQAYFDKMSLANVDPTTLLYLNRILGPVNRVDGTKARDAGITFDQKFSLTCQYVARPIGGVNTKAAMLDILANCLEIASVDAMFWGGGYHFNIHPEVYPFKNTAFKNRIMDDLYNGKIFGSDGALAHTVEGIKKFGTTDAQGNETGSFDWSNITGKLGEFLGETMGALGELINSVSNTIFGSSTSLGEWLKSTGNDVADNLNAANEGKTKMNSLFKNLNLMWRSLVVLRSVMPSVQGMGAVLTGEPVGNWHLTVGNPLNPIMVIGNLICTNMKVESTDELGPDDFPLEIKVTYDLEHAMLRDKLGIQSMFNRGMGKIYQLPDWIRASSDYESTVDKYTGVHNPASGKGISSFYTPQYMKASQLMRMGGTGYLTYKLSPAKNLAVNAHTDNTVIAKFTPPDIDAAVSNIKDNTATFFGANSGSRAWIRGIAATRKLMN